MNWTIKAVKNERLSTHVIEGGERASVVEWFFKATNENGESFWQKQATQNKNEEYMNLLAQCIQRCANVEAGVMEHAISSGLWEKVE